MTFMSQPGAGTGVCFHVGYCTLGAGGLGVGWNFDPVLPVSMLWQMQNLPSRKDLWPSCELCRQMTAPSCYVLSATSVVELPCSSQAGPCQ